MTVQINPTWVPGRWRCGVSLDVHTTSSHFLGYDDLGHPQFENTRSPLGELVFQLKYRSNHEVLNDIADTAASYLRILAKAPFHVSPTLIVPVPPSRDRTTQPIFLVAQALAARLGIGVSLDAVVRTRAVQELKAIDDYSERLDALRGVHEVQRQRTQGQAVLLIDDLFRSGASLNAVAGVLLDRGGVTDLCALTLTRTRSRR